LTNDKKLIDYILNYLLGSLACFEFPLLCDVCINLSKLLPAAIPTILRLLSILVFPCYLKIGTDI